MATPAAARQIVIYAIPGSQFVFKALAALQSRNVPHYVSMVPLAREGREKSLPSVSILVPQMKVMASEKDENPTIVTDSESILHWIDDNIENAGLYPTPLAKELSERASDHTLAAMVWYYNNIDPTGYKNSLQKSIARKLPWFVPTFVANAVIDSKMKPIKAEKRTSILEAIPDIDDATLDNEPAMRAKLIAELEFFQSHLKEPGQKYLLPGTRPTAPDFSVYAQMVRFVGGGTSDYEVYPACPELREVDSLKRLWEWYDLMKSEIFVEFKGKRAPQSML